MLELTKYSGLLVLLHSVSRTPNVKFFHIAEVVMELNLLKPSGFSPYHQV